jgi:hypothetical protein
LILKRYELQGSGSNEYVRYLSRALAGAGHTVHVLCRDEHAEKVPFVAKSIKWTAEGTSEVMFDRAVKETELGVPEGTTVGAITVHVLPHASVRPVFVTDKQRAGNVKAFVDMEDSELQVWACVFVCDLSPI